jgi:signal peptidase I
MRTNLNMRQCILSFWQKSGKQATAKIKGTSMSPVLEEGDIVTFHLCVSRQNIRPGDMVLLYSGSCLVVHRVLGSVENNGKLFFRQKGDNVLFVSFVCSESVIGKVVRIKKTNREIDLLSLNWRIINLIIGYYFVILYYVFNACVLAGRRLNEGKWCLRKKIKYRIMAFFVFLPLRFMKK